MSMMDKVTGRSPSRRTMTLAGVTFLAAAVLAFSGTALAQGDICGSDLVENVLDPMLVAAFQLGPLLGAVSGIVSLVMMSQVTSKDKKKKWKERRNDAFLYGVVGVLASGWIIDFFTSTIMQLDDEGCLNTSVLAFNHAADAVDVAAQVLPHLL